MRKISESAAALVKKIFERNAEVTAAYVTSDDQVFRSHNDALGQAGNLKRAGKSDEVTTITRAESGKQGAGSANEGGKEPGAPEMTEKEKAAKAVELATAKRAKAQANYDTAVENKRLLPEGAKPQTVRAIDSKIDKALGVLAEAETELAKAEAALADVDGE
jgi:hypothetical protein